MLIKRVSYIIKQLKPKRELSKEKNCFYRKLLSNEYLEVNNRMSL